MNMLKKILFFSALFSFLFVGQSFAASDPSFETLTPSSVTTESAVLHGEFDSNENNYFPTDMPVVWFEYGRDRYDLDEETSRVAKVKGNYMVSQGIIDLDEDTKYWYRTAISFDSDIDYGDTISFITDIEEEPEDDPDPVDNQGNDGGLSPEELLQQYYDGIRDPNIPDPQTDDGVVIDNDEPMSFFDFFRYMLWGKKKEKKEDSSLVYSKEELAEIERERQERLDRLSGQEKYNNSAAHDDELGEIVQYNTNYKNTYKTQNSNNYRGNGLNYPVLLFIIVLLILAIFLAYFFLRQRRRRLEILRRNEMRQTQQSNPGQQGRYYIPVNRDLQKPKEDPNKTFFRNPPKK